MTLGKIVFLLLTIVVIAEGVGLSQATGRTVRKRREVVEDDAVVTAEVSRAEAAMQKKDFASAEKDLTAAVERNPKNYRAWFDLGFVYNETDRTPQAIDAYRKSVEANPEVFESTLNLGILLARSDSPEAERYLRNATKLKPTAHAEEGWYRAWFSLGRVLQSTKPAEAIEAFRNASKLQPKNAEAHLSAGLVLEQQKQYAPAAAEYQKAAELDPKSNEALAGLVNAHSKLGQYGEAETWLHKWDEATAELEKGLQAEPGDAEAEKELAGIYMAQKLYPEAAPHINTALQKSPKDAELHYWLGLVSLNGRKYPDAQNEFMAAIKLKPDYGEAYGELALAASGNKNYVLTLQALQERAKYLPEVPGTYFLRATAFDSLKDFKQASENYKRFLAVADGRFPEEEWKARHRLIAIEPKKR
jgi:tetratricopeptide (TPR) repeat protein